MLIVELSLLKAPTEHSTPANELEATQVKVGVALKLLTGVNVRVEVPSLPGLRDSELGEALNEKSEGTVVKTLALDQVPFTPPEEASACTSQ
jgi:hypothetical protein